MENNFPDKKYLQALAGHMEERTARDLSVAEQISAYSGAALNWIADYINDANVAWTKEDMVIDDIYLTGTNPVWNRIIIQECERSPKKLRELLSNDEAVKKLFKDVQFSDVPILIRYDDGKLKVLDGMKRVIASIRDGRTKIHAFVARIEGHPAPQCEAHVIYDMLRAYQRGINTDKEGLVAALRFLRGSFSNVDALLKNRFNKEWLPDDALQKLVQEALVD